MTNNERQRLFQKRHPGYDRRRKARERAGYRQIAQWVRDRGRALVAQAALATQAPPAEPLAPITVEHQPQATLPESTTPAR